MQYTVQATSRMYSQTKRHPWHRRVPRRLTRSSRRSSTRPPIPCPPQHRQRRLCWRISQHILNSVRSVGCTRLTARTLYFGLVGLRFPHYHRSRLPVERIRRVRVAEELRKKDLEDVDHVVHRRPRLVDHIEAYGARPAGVSYMFGRHRGTDSSSMFGWKIRLTNPMLGLLYGYWSGSSTWIFQCPPVKGAGTVSTRSWIACRPRTLFGTLEPHIKLLPVTMPLTSCPSRYRRLCIHCDQLALDH